MYIYIYIYIYIYTHERTCVHITILPGTAVSCIYVSDVSYFFGGGTFRVRCSSGLLDRDTRIHPLAERTPRHMQRSPSHTARRPPTADLHEDPRDDSPMGLPWVCLPEFLKVP